MPEAIALVTADWHVRKFDRVWYRRDTLTGDTAWGIEQVLAQAEKFDVRSVMLLGDLFEQKLQQSDALATMREALDALQHQERAVYYVQGQHERSTPPLLAALHRWPQHIDGQTTTLANGAKVYGLDYKSPNEVKAALEAVPAGTDVLATHQVWKDFMGEDRGDAWFHWTSVPHILTGDFHQTLDETRGNVHVVSPGSLCMQKVDEPSEKFVYILWDNMTVEAVRLHTRGYFEARINSPDELDRFLDTWTQHPARIPKQGVPATVATNIIRIWYRADIPEARVRLEARVRADAHLFIKVVPVEEQQVSVDTERRVRAVLGGGLEGCIRTFYADKATVCEDAVRLARTRNISDELLHIYKDRLYGTDRQRKGPLPEQAQSPHRRDPRPDQGRAAVVEA